MASKMDLDPCSSKGKDDISSPTVTVATLTENPGAAGSVDSCEDVGAQFLKEFDQWQSDTASESIFLLEHQRHEDGYMVLTLLLNGEHEATLKCPTESSKSFHLDAPPMLQECAVSVNEYAFQQERKVDLIQMLTKINSLLNVDSSHGRTKAIDSMEYSDEEEEDAGMGLDLSDDDSAFTTEWELQVARKKKRWAQKEQEVREKLKKAKIGPSTSTMTVPITGEIDCTNQKKEPSMPLFTSCAASGILTNDLITIMQSPEDSGIRADPIDDNIYQWSVKLFNFDPDSPVAEDLKLIETEYCYNYIELQLNFAIDLYPLYPPMVKVIRPRLQGSMMQRVTNMELLKLSYWNPTKNMQSVLMCIKTFLQQWARLEIHSERNDQKKYPNGSYIDIEHHLLKLALVSEVNPRANAKYHMDIEKLPEACSTSEKRRTKEEYWARGVGFGHNKRPEWDIAKYLAAQKEKDKQIEEVLHNILQELKKLYAAHAPQLKPRTKQDTPQDEEPSSEFIDPVQDMFTVLEGSALIPFIEQHLKADSFLEICRHTVVYKAIIDIIREIAMQQQLLELIGTLPDQLQSVYDLLKTLEEKASLLLQHIYKAGNGSVPKAPKESPISLFRASAFTKKQKASSSTDSATHHTPPAASSEDAEKKLAREFQILFKDVTEAFKNAGKSPSQPSSSQETLSLGSSTTTEEVVSLEDKYEKLMAALQFDSCDINLEGSSAHHYANSYLKQAAPPQSQVFRIAQEVTSLSSSLPLSSSSAIFVRTDDEKLTLMRALIIGPEGTPYSAGCFLFDIFFPNNYPKVPPMVNLQTTGGGTVRFNPNLYNDGKVCLSLLGTWQGQQGEQWNETTSTVLQVLVSIQSLILVPDPYFNEPGYEQEIGTESGKRHNEEYTAEVQINTIKHAMISQLKKPSPGFEEVIKTHFYIKKDKILQTVEEWMLLDKSSKLERAYQNLKTQLLKLKPPPNVANSTSTTTTSQEDDTSTDI